MPSGSWIKADVRCPFYRADMNDTTIKCEGIIDDSGLTLTFYHKRDFVKQVTVFCCDRFQNCEIYRMLKEAKYEEDT